MKSPIRLLLVVSAAVFLSGCSGRQESDATASTSQPRAEQRRTPVAVSAKYAGSAKTVGNFKAGAGKKYAMFDVVVRNIDARDQNVGTAFLTLRTSDSKVYAADIATLDSSVDSLTSVTTQPGDVVEGRVVFEMPEDAKPTSITFDGINFKVFVKL